MEALLNVDVMLVSRSPQKLANAPSSVQVITDEDIRNSGATNIAEALRLVSNLQVTQQRSNSWIIGSRGMNGVFANKLLVMIDGRTVYTPLFAGVLWDLQHVLLEDVEKIEVVSGPGGALWGANAVNGVINIVTRKTSATQGLYASVQAGSFIRDHLALRWGGKIGKHATYKIYGQHFDRDATKDAVGTKFQDAWRANQAGFRFDWSNDKADSYLVQGDYAAGTVKTSGDNSNFNAQNVLARWRHEISSKSALTMQVYYDHYYKQDAPGASSDEIHTADLDIQYNFPLGSRHSISTGAGYRRVADRFIASGTVVAILPEKKNLDLVTAFVQDEISINSKWKLNIGSKVIHNVYTGIEFQPGARISFDPGNSNSLWAAVTRAVRTPSRIDVDYYSPRTPQPPTVVSVAGGPDFKSETVIAYELGYRVALNARSAFSVSTFYNHYDDLYSLEPRAGTLTYEIRNGTKGQTWGVEFSGTYQLMDNWRLRGGYTYIDKKLQAASKQAFDPSYLGNDAKNQVLIQSMSQINTQWHIDIIARYLDFLPVTFATATVPSYFTFDLRLAYTLRFAELSLVGMNLYSKHHSEFGSLQIPRSIFGKVTIRL